MIHTHSYISERCVKGTILVKAPKLYMPIFGVGDVLGVTSSIYAGPNGDKRYCIQYAERHTRQTFTYFQAFQNGVVREYWRGGGY